uniref:F-box domain-containing protein n=2 Tax=Solanum TaxID=4107 RepID=A4UV16_SOLTU|nr:Putative F-box domain containing protein, identical [Solanum demissum]ABO92976.1 F-box domain-containing protein [Solanum tuberosum]
MAESIISVLPHEIIIEILLKVPPKSLLKFMCISKSWLELISSAKFIKKDVKLTANDKEYSHRRIIFQESAHNLSKIEETVLWNPAINKSKKLPTLGAKLRDGFSYYLKYGFGYDKTRDDYKVTRREEGWSFRIVMEKVVIRWHLEWWEVIFVLCLNCIEGTNPDVRIMKDCGVEVSWTKIFTVDHPKDLGEFIFFTSIFSLPCYQSNKDEILLLLYPVIMTYNGSTRQVEVVDQFEECAAAEIYVESLVDPLLIS